MTRHFFTFLSTFVAGALLALVARAAWFNPNPDHTGHTAGGGDYAPMVANTAGSSTTVPPSSAPPGHDAHDAPARPAPRSSPEVQAAPAHAAATVNSVCAICGMEVDSDLPTAEYQGKTIGFGCKVCPAQFKANPDKYGPAALRNEVVKG